MHLRVCTYVLAIALLCLANDATQLAHDTQGKTLSSRESYYILPAKQGSGGGLTATPNGQRCLAFVFQVRDETFLGDPLRFTPLPPNHSADEPIRLSTDIWIEFRNLSNFCVERLDWHLTNKSPETAGLHVAAGNEDGTRSFGLFRIERHGTDTTGYKLMSCAKKGSCRYLGLHVFKGMNWLTVSHKPYVVVFKKKT
ncbi:hypothetical protein BRADI_4g01470v3 [Brachypodium distachyon]|uniref:Uncharacterized protein n=1 Tax=Brachypodium distachyon TaxID=15368 RepID=A0A0Q3HCD4_BRADI|nr:hypothetical protein BRADI_4g01470v3 [Brachypodium distachyon]